MAKLSLQFPPLGFGNEQGYTNSGIETFKGNELIDNLAREICQNSLDAKSPHDKNPVVVKFKLQTLKTKDFPVFSDYKSCIEGCKKYWVSRMDVKLKTFIQRVDEIIKQDEIKILVASDYNTTGLTGIDAQNYEHSTWRALVQSDGVSSKQEGSGGSYGIGKNAPFACSDLSMVFYNTYAVDNKQAFKGIARLATLLQNNESTQSVGHYQNNQDIKPILPSDECPLRDKFKRNQFGTDIIITGCNRLTENDNWQEKLEQAIIKNFLLAIMEGKLVTEVENTVINAASLPKLIEKYTESKNMQLAINIYETLTSPDRTDSTKIIEETQETDVRIYIKSDKKYKKEIANFRSTGMLIGTNTKNMLQKYTAVMVAEGETLCELLRASEPPKHNKWDYKLVEDKSQQKKAKEALKKINQWIITLLKEEYESVTSDPIDSGEGEYLPDEIDDLTNMKSGDDKLRPVQKILEIKEKKSSFDTDIDIAKKEMGDIIEEPLETRNRNVNPTPYPKPKIPVHVDNNTDTEDKTEGINKGNGTKTLITTPEIKMQRVFPINYKIGLYQVVILPQNNCENTFINFSVIGEGGTKEPLEILMCKVDSQPIPFKDSRIGPLSLSAEKTQKIFVNFKNKEKMLINLEITEEKKK